MKNIYLYLFFVFSIPTFAQPEFAPVGTVWTYQTIYEQYYPPFNHYFGLYKAICTKDSLINNRVYKKIARTIFQPIPGDTDRKDMLIRQEGEKIFILFDKEYVLYDFSSNVGDTVKSTGIDGVFNNLKTIDIVIKNILYDTIGGEIFKVQKAYFICFALQTTHYLHQKYGCLSEADLFFPENLCIIDFEIPVNLRCYKEPNFPEINFDSIPCDSIRPNIIKTNSIEPKQHQFMVYPNLFQNKIHIKSNTESIQIIEIFNTNGNRVYFKKINSPIQNTELNLEHLNSGLYFIKILGSNGENSMKKIVKQ